MASAAGGVAREAAGPAGGRAESDLTDVTSPANMNSGKLQGVYEACVDELEKPQMLEVSYADGHGGAVREVLFVDPVHAEARPRVCVSVSGVQAMHNAVSVLSRKVDSLVHTLQTCRSAYYKELTSLREQLQLQALGDEDAYEPRDVSFFSKSAFFITEHLAKRKSDDARSAQLYAQDLANRLAGSDTECARLREINEALSMRVDATKALSMKVDAMKDPRDVVEELLRQIGASSLLQTIQQAVPEADSAGLFDTMERMLGARDSTGTVREHAEVDSARQRLLDRLTAQATEREEVESEKHSEAMRFEADRRQLQESLAAARGELQDAGSRAEALEAQCAQLEAQVETVPQSGSHGSRGSRQLRNSVKNLQTVRGICGPPGGPLGALAAPEAAPRVGPIEAVADSLHGENHLAAAARGLPQALKKAVVGDAVAELLEILDTACPQRAEGARKHTAPGSGDGNAAARAEEQLESAVFDPARDLSPKGRQLLIVRSFRQLPVEEVQAVAESIGGRAHKAILSSVFENVDPAELKHCAELLSYVSQGTSGTRSPLAAFASGVSGDAVAELCRVLLRRLSWEEGSQLVASLDLTMRRGISRRALGDGLIDAFAQTAPTDDFSRRMSAFSRRSSSLAAPSRRPSAASPAGTAGLAAAAAPAAVQTDAPDRATAAQLAAGARSARAAGGRAPPEAASGPRRVEAPALRAALEPQHALDGDLPAAEAGDGAPGPAAPEPRATTPLLEQPPSPERRAGRSASGAGRGRPEWSIARPSQASDPGSVYTPSWLGRAYQEVAAEGEVAASRGDQLFHRAANKVELSSRLEPGRSPERAQSCPRIHLVRSAYHEVSAEEAVAASRSDRLFHGAADNVELSSRLEPGRRRGRSQSCPRIHPGRSSSHFSSVRTKRFDPDSLFVSSGHTCDACSSQHEPREAGTCARGCQTAIGVDAQQVELRLPQPEHGAETAAGEAALGPHALAVERELAELAWKFLRRPKDPGWQGVLRDLELRHGALPGCGVAVADEIGVEELEQSAAAQSHQPLAESAGQGPHQLTLVAAPESSLTSSAAARRREEATLSSQVPGSSRQPPASFNSIITGAAIKTPATRTTNSPRTPEATSPYSTTQGGWQTGQRRLPLAPASASPAPEPVAHAPTAASPGGAPPEPAMAEAHTAPAAPAALAGPAADTAPVLPAAHAEPVAGTALAAPAARADRAADLVVPDSAGTEQGEGDGLAGCPPLLAPVEAETFGQAETLGQAVANPLGASVATLAAAGPAVATSATAAAAKLGAMAAERAPVTSDGPAASMVAAPAGATSASAAAAKPDEMAIERVLIERVSVASDSPAASMVAAPAGGGPAEVAHGEAEIIGPASSTSAPSQPEQDSPRALLGGVPPPGWDGGSQLGAVPPPSPSGGCKGARAPLPPGASSGDPGVAAAKVLPPKVSFRGSSPEQGDPTTTADTPASGSPTGGRADLGPAASGPKLGGPPQETGHPAGGPLPDLYSVLPRRLAKIATPRRAAEAPPAPPRAAQTPKRVDVAALDLPEQPPAAARPLPHRAAKAELSPPARRAAEASQARRSEASLPPRNAQPFGEGPSPHVAPDGSATSPTSARRRSHRSSARSREVGPPRGGDEHHVPAPPLLAGAPPKKVHSLAALTQLHNQAPASDAWGPPGAAPSRSARGRAEPRAPGAPLPLEGPQSAWLPRRAPDAGQPTGDAEEAEPTGPAPPAPVPRAPPSPEQERSLRRSVRMEVDVRQLAPPSAELESLLRRPKRSAAGTGCDSQECKLRTEVSNERLPQLLAGLQGSAEAQPSPRRDNTLRIDKDSASNVVDRVRSSLQSNYGSLNTAWRCIEADSSDGAVPVAVLQSSLIKAGVSARDAHAFIQALVVGASAPMLRQAKGAKSPRAGRLISVSLGDVAAALSGAPPTRRAVAAARFAGVGSLSKMLYASESKGGMSRRDARTILHSGLQLEAPAPEEPVFVLPSAPCEFRAPDELE